MRPIRLRGFSARLHISGVKLWPSQSLTGSAVPGTIRDCLRVKGRNRLKLNVITVKLNSSGSGL